jgi:DNA-binding SARP family transcriptional activator
VLALWPLEGGSAKLAGPQRKTVMNVVSRARALIGYGANGHERVIHSSDGYYLAPEVTCDLDRFRALARLAETAPAAQALGHLSQALELVRGEPFAGAVSSQFFEWAICEHLDLGATAEILDVAEALALAAVEAGDHQMAVAAARKGLGLDPLREQLCCAWMEAAGRRGDVAEVDQVYRRLCQVLRQRLHPLQEPGEAARRIWAGYCRQDLAGSAAGAMLSPWAI